ncbi:MAG: hypothetical protein Q8N98_04150, partial [bacterium]|nr:hypothetical protein [bacterium]
GGEKKRAEILQMATLKPEIAILESKLDPKKGPMVTVIVLAGTLKPGISIVASGRPEKIKALFDETGKQIEAAGPGTPAEVLGFGNVFKAGEIVGTKKERLMELTSLPENDKPKVIIVCDTAGSLEAIKVKLTDAEILEEKTGEINESEVLLAKAAGAIIIGFNAKTSSATIKLADAEKVKIYTFRIVYELLDFYLKFKQGLVKEEQKEESLGKARIIAEFPFNKLRVAGVKVLEGRIARGDTVRLEREEEKISGARIKSIKRQKEDVSKAEAGGECGIFLEPQLDFMVGDMIISYRTI